jgi:hypothetical protein
LVARALAAFTAWSLLGLQEGWLTRAQAQSAGKRIPRPFRRKKQSKTRLVEFELSPFPYEGINPATGKPFINVDETGRRGRMNPPRQVLWEDETFSDQRVLLHIPPGFDIRKPAIIIVFFHGHGAAIDRDVRDRQRIAEQITKSGANAVLVAPQMAVKAADSSAGIFWEQGMFAQFLNEASEQLALLHGGSA